MGIFLAALAAFFVAAEPEGPGDPLALERQKEIEALARKSPRAHRGDGSGKGKYLYRGKGGGKGKGGAR